MSELMSLQDMANGHLDVKALGEAANGDENTIVTTRTGNTYPSAERAINIMFQNGGLPAKPFPTLAKMGTEGASLADGQLAMVYNETANNGLYVKTAGAWTKSAYDPLTLAKAYTDSSKPTLKTSESVNLYDSSKLITDKYVKSDGSSFLTSPPAEQRTALIVPVDSGVTYYIRHNQSTNVANKMVYSKSDTTLTAANYISDVTLVATPTPNLFKFTPPVGAAAVFMTTSSIYSTINFDLRTTLDIRNGEFFVGGNSGLAIEAIDNKKLKDSFAREKLTDLLLRPAPDVVPIEIKSGNTTVGDFYNISNAIVGKYINSSGSTLLSDANCLAYRIPVNDGDVVYFKIVGSRESPFKMVYSSSATVLTFLSDVTLQPTGMKDVFKVVVTGATVKAIYMNVKQVVLANVFDISQTLSIQFGYFDTANIGLHLQAAISKINNFSLVDTEARRLASVSAGNSKAQSRLAAAKVLALGDSITEGTQGGYIQHIDDILGVVTNNRGSSGARSYRLVDIAFAGEGLARRDTANATAWTPIDYTDLDCCFIMIGTNDAVTSYDYGSLADIPKFNYTAAADKTAYWESFPNTFTANLAMIIELIRVKSPKCEIHLISPPYRNNGTDVIVKMIPLIKAVAEYYAVHFINATYESGLGYKDMLQTVGAYSYDGIHLTTLGNEVFGKFLANKILSFG